MYVYTIAMLSSRFSVVIRVHTPARYRLRAIAPGINDDALDSDVVLERASISFHSLGSSHPLRRAGHLSSLCSSLSATPSLFLAALPSDCAKESRQSSSEIWFAINTEESGTVGCVARPRRSRRFPENSPRTVRL